MPMAHDDQIDPDWLAERLTAVMAERDDLRADLVRIAAILFRFYESGTSIHTLQPVLDLAVELNPFLVESHTSYD